MLVMQLQRESGFAGVSDWQLDRRFRRDDDFRWMCWRQRRWIAACAGMTRNACLLDW